MTIPLDIGAERQGAVSQMLHHRRSPEEIADRMRVAAYAGVLVGGDRLAPERRLTGELGASRETVRTALRLLVTDGHIFTRRGRGGGTFIEPVVPSPEGYATVLRVLDPIWSDLEELLDLRSLIRSLVCSTSAKRRSEEQVVEMYAALAQLRGGTSAGEWRRAMRRVGDAISASVRNHYLVTEGASLKSLTNLGFATDPWTPELHRIGAGQVAAIVDAIAARDATRAGSASISHMQAICTSPWRMLLSQARDAATSPGNLPRPLGLRASG